MGDTNYREGRTFADTFLATQKIILADLFGVTSGVVRTSTDSEDWNDGVDVYVADIGVGLRVRRHSDRPFKDFTLRLRRNQNGHHELDKVRAGKIAFLLYCIDTSAPGTAATDLAWWLIDLAPIRKAGMNLLADVKTELQGNKDGTTFLAIDLESLIAKYGPVLMAMGTTTTTTTTVTTTKTVHPDFAPQGERHVR